MVLHDFETTIPKAVADLVAAHGNPRTLRTPRLTAVSTEAAALLATIVAATHGR